MSDDGFRMDQAHPLPTGPTAMELEDPNVFSQLDVGEGAANVWMHEAGPAAQASWPAARPDPELSRAQDNLAKTQFDNPHPDFPSGPSGYPGDDLDVPPQGPPQGPPQTGAPAPARRVGGGGGYGAPITPNRYYYSPDYEAELEHEFGDEGLNKRWDDRMAEAYKLRFDGKITEEEFQKRRKKADAARESERGEKGKRLAEYRKWQQSPIGREMTIARMGYAQQDRAAQSRQEQLQAAQWAAQMQQGAQQRMMREAEEAKKEADVQRAEHDEAYQRETDKLQTAVKELDKMDLNPNAYWEKKGPLGTLFTLIGAGLLGAAGKPELALKNVRDGINTELQAQSKRIDVKKAGIANRKMLLGVMREKYGDIDRAEQAAQAYAYRKFANRVRLYSAKAGSDAKESQMLATADLLDMEAQKREAILDHQARGMAEQEMLMKARMRAGAMAQRAKAAQREAQGYELKGSDFKRYVPGVGLALPGSDVKDLRDSSAALVGQTRLVRQARALLAKARGGTVLTPAEKNVLVSVQSQLQTPEIKKVAGASMTDAEMDRIMPGIGGEFSDWTTRNWGGAQSMLGNYERHLRAQTREKFGAHVEQGQDMEVINDKGRRSIYFKPRLGAGTSHNTAQIQAPK